MSCISDYIVHDSTIRKRPHEYDLFGRVARAKPLLSKQNMVAHCRFATLHLNKPQDLCSKVFREMKRLAMMLCTKFNESLKYIFLKSISASPTNYLAQWWRLHLTPLRLQYGHKMFFVYWHLTILWNKTMDKMIIFTWCKHCHKEQSIKEIFQ